MELIKETEKMKTWARRKRAEGLKIGFVPTMGYLHQGHLSLMEYARPHCDQLVVSIFVNPTQFGPTEDFSTYPQDLDRDLDLMRPIPVDLVFKPTPEQIYPDGFQTYVEVTQLTQRLCGLDRPTHFRGVTTVVAKLFNIVRPHLAVFGQKDYQQLVVIQRMVKDLNMDVEVVGRPTVREADGLAMSSRNVHLRPEERKSALSLFESLKLAQKMVRQGKRNAAEILAAVKKHIEDKPHTQLHYAVLVDPETLEDVEAVEDKALLALAAVVGKPRLIDNAIITAD